MGRIDIDEIRQGAHLVAQDVAEHRRIAARLLGTTEQIGTGNVTDQKGAAGEQR
ncbi:MAG: hypothetical protein LJE91_15845 [Gammaproteobacteria bacterium]|jgi:hypothetical protein|nr:hypothetical protein [Gammaproteobacteria bacterium]